jgi:hypothetical protein
LRAGVLYTGQSLFNCSEVSADRSLVGGDSDLQQQALESDLAEFMSEFARFLVAAGITNSQLARVVRQALFRAASASARFSNSRLNQSAVAAMTGLARVQVRDLARANRATVRRKPDYLEKVVNAWNSDPSFASSSYVPRRLSTSGKHATFSKLVRKYGGDVSTRSILREMVRNELVTVKGKYVQLNQQVRQTRGQTRLHQLSQGLTQLLKNPNALERSIFSTRPVVMEVAYPSSSPKGRILMQKKSAEALRAFLSELQAIGIAASLETPPKSKRIGSITRTRVLVLTDDLEQRASESMNRK